MKVVFIMDDKIESMLTQNLYLVWHNGGIFKDRVKQGIFIIMKAVKITAHELKITEQQIVNAVSVYRMGDILLSL